MSLYERALSIRPLVHVAQWMVTGEWTPRRIPMLAESVAEGPHDFVLDLGCGGAPILRFIDPKRYVGIDEHAPSLDQAQRAQGREFFEASITAIPFERWPGADVVTIASVTHHLSDAQVTTLIRRVSEVGPKRILIQDAQPTGPLGPLVARLDAGAHFRSRETLAALLGAEFDARALWDYDNPLRSFHQYLLQILPRR